MVDDGDLLLGLHEGLYRSDGGVRWEPAGLQGEDAMAVVASASGPLVVGGHGVLFWSDDGGETFHPLSPSDLPSLDIHALAQAPTEGEVLYAYVVGFGLFWSGDGGGTWEQRADLSVVPPDLLGLAVVGSGSERLVVVTAERGILLSVDGGRSLERVEEMPAWAVAGDPASPGTVLALAASGLVASDDAGETWGLVDPLDGLEGGPVALAVDGGEVWVATEQPRRLYRSSDGDSTWELVSSA